MEKPELILEPAPLLKINEVINYYYAQLDDNQACFCICALSAPSDAPNLIAIKQDADVMGKIWDGKTWNDAPVIIDKQPKNLTLLEFRALFSLREKMTLDNADLVIPNEQIQLKMMIKTLMADLNASTFIDPLNPDILQGIGLLSAYKLLDHERRGVDILCALRRISIEEAHALLA